MEFGCRVCPTPYAESYPQGRPARLRLPFSARRRHGAAMSRLHLHLISDSTGETLENIAKAAIAQFDDAAVVRTFWPMVRSDSHLDRLIAEVEASPGMILLDRTSVVEGKRVRVRVDPWGGPR